MHVFAYGMGDADEDVFEINDFTVITDLERFAVSLELAFHDWNLCNVVSNNFAIVEDLIHYRDWDMKEVKVVYSNEHAFTLQYYWPTKLKRTVQRNEFASNQIRVDENCDVIETDLQQTIFFSPYSVICTQFGVMEFLLLLPFKTLSDQITDETHLRTILSGICIALSSSQCSLPIFVQYGNPEQHLYSGICQNNYVRTTFETASVRAPLPEHDNLEGLKQIFREKLNIPVESNEVEIAALVFYEYVVKSHVVVPRKCRFDDRDDSGDSVLQPFKTKLPFGTPCDPIDEIILCALYPLENAIDDSWFESNLSPFSSPTWIFNVAFKENFPCLMHLCLSTLVDTMDSKEATVKVSDVAPPFNSYSIANEVFSSLTSSPSISITSPAGAFVQSDLLPTKTLLCWIDSIFLPKLKPDHISSRVVINAEVRNDSMNVHLRAQSNPKCNEKTLNVRLACEDSIRRCKAAPSGSLTERIAIALIQALCLHESSTTAFAQLWMAFIGELRNYWQSNLMLPSFNPNEEVLDYSMCKFHQLLQMLQCCIERRVARFKAYQSILPPDEDDSENEQFFDALDSSCYRQLSCNPPGTVECSAPTGRKCVCDGMFLLNDDKEPIYEPFVQNRLPMTEAMAEKYSNKLLSMDVESRKKVQLGILLSDMQSFKAANHKCVFEDFIRWHSPTDYVEDGLSGSGRLSQRMSGKNLWKETWNSCPAVPAYLQKQLFNEAKEAELIFEELGSATLADIIGLIMPVVLKYAATQLLSECRLDVQDTDMLSFCAKLFHFTKSNNSEDLIYLLHEMLEIEECITKYSAVLDCLNSIHESSDTRRKDGVQEIEDLVTALMRSSKEERVKAYDNETNIVRGMVINRRPYNNDFISVLLTNLFVPPNARRSLAATKFTITGKSKSKRVLEEEWRVLPTRRHYIMQCMAPMPFENSSPTFQRMYAALSKNRFRLCSAFSEDNKF